MIQLGVPPLRLDILTSISGVEFAEAWSARSTIDMDGIPLPVLSRAHLIQNKRATGRPRDQLDLRWLEGEPEPS